MSVPLLNLPLRSETSRSRSCWYPSAAIEQTIIRPVRKHRAFLFKASACGKVGGIGTGQPDVRLHPASHTLACVRPATRSPGARWAGPTDARHARSSAPMIMQSSARQMPATRKLVLSGRGRDRTVSFSSAHLKRFGEQTRLFRTLHEPVPGMHKTPGWHVPARCFVPSAPMCAPSGRYSFSAGFLPLSPVISRALRPYEM
jgi:hypothetical protein